MEVVTVLMGVFTFLLTCMVGLLTHIWHDSNKRRDLEMKAMREAVRTNGKHLDSIIHSVWQHNWRINGMEDFLADTTEFRPPRIIGESETFKPGS